MPIDLMRRVLTAVLRLCHRRASLAPKAVRIGIYVPNWQTIAAILGGKLKLRLDRRA